MAASPPSNFRRRNNFDKPRSSSIKHHKINHPSRSLDTGKIVHLCNDFGFLAPLLHPQINRFSSSNSDDTVTSDDNHKNVFFRINAVDTGFMNLIVGDYVQFKSYDNTEKPRAVFARLVGCAPRSLRVMGSYLTILLDKFKEDPGLVLREITKCPTGLKLALAQSSPTSDMVASILEIADTFCQWRHANVLYTSRLKDFFRLFPNSEFLTSEHALRKSVSDSKSVMIPRLVLTLLEHFPESLSSMLPLIQELVQSGADACRSIIPIPNSIRHACPSTDFVLRVLKLVANVTDSSENRLNSSWDKLPLLPIDSELGISVHSGAAASTDLQRLPVIKVGEKYRSPDVYLDTYFRLLREDCFAALKKGISAFRAGELDQRDMRVWIHANPIGVIFRETLPGLVVALECRLSGGQKGCKNVVLPMSGSLLCICDDGGEFQSPIWAVVLASEKAGETKAILSVEIVEGSDAESNNDSDVSMVGRVLRGSDMLIAESPTYYKAYKPVLKALQKIDPEEIPFKDELVDLRLPGTRARPAYITRDTVLNWRCIFTEDSMGATVIQGNASDFDWLQQQGYKTTFDLSQIEAVEHTLNNRLSLIQGPPGTGKTFLGVKILELLLSASTLPSRPVLVVTFKNQALDQFLESCLKFCGEPGSLVRVGGRGTNVNLQNCNLNMLREKADEFSSDWRDNARKLEQLQAEMEELLEDLHRCKSFSMKAIISHAPEGLLEQFLSQTKPNRELLMSLPQGMSVQKALQDGLAEHPNPALSLKLRQVLHTSVKMWIPTHKVFKLVQNCLLARLSSEDLIESFLPSSTSKDDSEESTDKGGFDLEEEENEERNAELEDMQEVQFTGLASKGETNSLHNKIKRFKNQTDDLLLPNFQLFYVDVQKYEWLLRVNPWHLSSEQRCILIVVIMQKSVEALSGQLSVLKEKYDCICQDNDEIMKRRNVKVLESAKIVGMTTTGAALHQDILSILSPAIIVVEEAGEILEAQLLAVLRPSVQHCILIGDHCQLRPSVSSYELDRCHNLGISLFERIAESHTIPYKTLRLQCRMRHEFLPMLLPIYPDLRTNMKLVSGDRNQPPSCMKTSMFFWSHSHEETVQRSYANDGEVHMVVALVKWLLANGHKSEEITVLAAYNGQVALLRKNLKDIQENEGDIGVHTIDRFQGSENQIVIVSLVRSNKDARIGHLKLRNRLCVSVSRARSAVYLCGNRSTLTTKSLDWQKLVLYFDTKGCFGNAIPIQCPRHPETSDYSINSHRAESFTAKLCKRPCTAVLDCGHRCSDTCHTGGHRKCEVLVKYTCRNCAQRLSRLCSEKEADKPCDNTVFVTLAACGHLKQCKCWEKQAHGHSILKCDQVCGKKLSCGHLCGRLCSENCNSMPCKACEDIKREIAKKEMQQKYNEIAKQLQEIESRKEAGFLIEEITREGENADEYHWVKDRTEKYIQPTHNICPRVTKIEKIRNLKLQALCLKAQRDLINPTKPSQYLFHGTDDKGITGITSNGFRLPAKDKRNMFGAGCYFATDSSKSAQQLYTKGSSKLLLCEVFLGLVWSVKEAKPDLDLETVRKKGYDSVYSVRDSEGSGGTLYDEYVIYDPRQALPRYIIHYENVEINTPKFKDIQKHARGGFSRITLLPSNNFSDDIFTEYHFRMAESQFYRMSNLTSKKVVKVEVIHNAELSTRYNFMKGSFANQKMPTDETFVFHGTTKESIEKIIKEGFKVGGEGVPMRCGAAHGRGVYTATNPEISMPYSKDAGMMLLSLLLVGNENVNHTKAGENVIVVKDARQLLPLYIVHFS